MEEIIKLQKCEVNHDDFNDNVTSHELHIMKFSPM